VSLEELAGAWDSLRGTEGATQKTEEELLKEALPGVESELKGMQIELRARACYPPNRRLSVQELSS
jgi:hypothetical protein